MTAKPTTKVPGRYRKVEVRTWGDERFRALSPIPPCGQGLWLYLITGPYTGPIPGLFSAGRAAMAEDLGWSTEAFGEAFGEAFEQGMVKADFKARVVFIPNAIKHNRPESPNVVRSWAAAFDLIPECDLKREAFDALKVSIHALGEAFGKAFDEAFPKPSPKAMPKPSPKAMPNQEQEQEQEQDSLGQNDVLTEGGVDEEKPTAKSARQKKPKATVHGFPPGFERFWNAYPRKVKKDSAAHAFAQRKPDTALVDVMVAAIEVQKHCDQWCKDRGQFIPYPATWLNGAQWLDEDSGAGVSPELADMFARGRAP